MKSNTENITTETIEAIIEELLQNPRMHQYLFTLIMLKSFSDIDSKIKYDFNSTTSTHSIRVPGYKLALDITWTNAVEAANELAWFLNKLKAMPSVK